MPKANAPTQPAAPKEEKPGFWSTIKRYKKGYDDIINALGGGNTAEAERKRRLEQSKAKKGG